MSESYINASISAIGIIVAASITGIVAFFGGKGSAQAQLQNSLNAFNTSVMHSLERERTHCEEKLKAMQLQLDTEGRSLRQHISSLEEVIRRAGIEVPRHRPAEIIYVLDSQEKTNEQ